MNQYKDIFRVKKEKKIEQNISKKVDSINVLKDRQVVHSSCLSQVAFLHHRSWRFFAISSECSGPEENRRINENLRSYITVNDLNECE